MKKIALIGNGATALAIEIMATAQRNDIEIIVVEQENKNQVFESEPFLIKNTFIEPPTYYEHKPSKFISKPKNNFKRR